MVPARVAPRLPAQTVRTYPSQSGPQRVVVSLRKEPGIAAVLSFFWCGLGQIYNGQIGKGVLMMVAYPICLLISWGGLLALIGGMASTRPDSGSLLPLGLLMLAAAPALWIGGMAGAYRTAERINEEANFE